MLFCLFFFWATWRRCFGLLREVKGTLGETIAGSREHGMPVFLFGYPFFWLFDRELKRTLPLPLPPISQVPHAETSKERVGQLQACDAFFEESQGIQGICRENSKPPLTPS